MLSQEDKERIRKIEMHARRLVAGMAGGVSRSPNKGSGFDFDQLREYQSGDDFRAIDWKSSARVGKHLVKQYREERNRTVLLVVDTSPSSFYGSGSSAKYDFLSYVAGIIAYVAYYHNDRIALILSGEYIDCWLPPRNGKSQIGAIVNALIDFDSSRTRGAFNVGAVVERISSIRSRSLLTFFISDCIGVDWQELRTSVGSRGLVVLTGVDSYERMFPSVGRVRMEDIETGRVVMYATDSMRGGLQQALVHRLQQQEQVCKNQGVRHIVLHNGDSHLTSLVEFFRYNYV